MASKKMVFAVAAAPPLVYPMKWEKHYGRESYEFQTKRIRIILHRHIVSPDTWFVSCYEAGVERRELSAKDADAAKLEAVKFIRDRLFERFTDADRAFDATKPGEA